MQQLLHKALMKNRYSQFTALNAITKASFRAIFKSPQTLFFSILFPLVFILIFSAFGDGKLNPFTIGIDKNSDTSNVVYRAIKNHDAFHIIDVTDTAKTTKLLDAGKIAGIINIQAQADSSQPYILNVLYTNASDIQVARMYPVLQNISYNLNNSLGIAKIDIKSNRREIREYKNIDFVLPGQIGFSILFATLFGVAFTFYNLREQLVLKRFFATPVNKLTILIGIGISRIAFQLLSVIVLIVIGHYFLDFTLVNGIFTVIDMLVLTVIMLFLLLGVGLIFSSVVKTDTTIPLFINIFSLPQMLVSGTFFSTAVFPGWIQKASLVLPLTHFNNAMRQIAFEGASLVSCWQEILVLLGWTVLVYIVTIKLFKWE